MSRGHPAHGQPHAGVRFEWGLTGALACAGPATVVVDVLSFTTTLTVALERGIEVFPFRWGDVRATAYAQTRDAVLAVGRRQAAPGQVSLSPRSVRAAEAVRRLVLPSPNGSAICFGLADSGTAVYAASLRNARAVAAALAPRVLAGEPLVVVAAGERWADGSLRPAVEDLWGAGAVIAALSDLGVGALSVEAGVAETAYRSVAARLPAALHGCASGRELASCGFGGDVDVAAELDASAVVPLLRGEAFGPA